MPERSAKPVGARWITAVLLVYTALTVVFTWPAVQQLSTHILGGPRDGPMFLWNLWWVPHALFDLGQLPFETKLLFYPTGTSLVVNTHCFLPSLLSAPLQWCLGLVPAFNLTVLSTFVLTGLGGFLLAYEVTQRRAVALVAGAMLTFCHFRVSTVMFLNLLQTQWLVLFAWALMRMVRRRSWKAALAAGGFAACLFYSSYNLLVLAALLGVLFFLWTLCWEWKVPGSARSLVKNSAIVTTTLLVLGAPLLWSLVQEIQKEENYVTLENSSKYNVVTPLSSLVRHPSFGTDKKTQIREASYLGWSVLVAALLGLSLGFRRKDTWFFALLTILFLVLALGPVLKWEGVPGVEEAREGFVLPYAWVSKWPLLKELRVPHRYGLVGTVALTMLAAIGLAEATRRLASRPGLEIGVCSLLLGLVFVDLAQLPFAKLYRLPEAPSVLSEIAADPRDCTVLEFPAGRTGYPAFSYFETIHERPVYANGQTARIAPPLREMSENSTILRHMNAVFDGSHYAQKYWRQIGEVMRAEAAAARIGWIILAWADTDALLARGRKYRQKELADLDTLVRSAFDVEDVKWKASTKEVERWSKARPAVRKSALCLWRVYKLKLPPP